MKRQTSGFSLVELMIVVAIIGILGAIAIPAYGNYVMRGRLTEAFTALGAAQLAAEEFWSNKHTYVGLDGSTTPATTSRLPPDTANFTYTLVDASASAYTIKATGRAQAANFIYTIDQNAKRATTKVPTGWGSVKDCWIDRKGGACVQ